MERLSRDDALLLTTIVDRNIDATIIMLQRLISIVEGSLPERRQRALGLVDRIVSDTAKDLERQGVPEDALQITVDTMRNRFYLGLMETE